MSHLIISHKPKFGRGFTPCSNGCVDGGNVKGRKAAVTCLWVIGRPILVCKPCARAMAEAYESATDEAVYREVA